MWVRGRWRQSSSLSRIRLVSVILDSGLISVIIEKEDVLNVRGFAVKLSSPTFVGLQPEEGQSAIYPLA